MNPLEIVNRRNELDPLPELGPLCAESPLLRVEEEGVVGWLALGRDEVRAVLGDTDRFITLPPADTLERARQLAEPGNLLHWNPPEHTRYRKMLAPEFTPRRVREMTPDIQKYVDEQLDILERSGPPADLMRSFVWPVCGRICALLLGLPRDDMAELIRHVAVRAHRSGRQQSAASRAYTRYVRSLVERRRAEPGDDLLSRLVLEHGDDVSDAELAGLFSSVAFSELEGTAHMTGVGMLALLRHPDQLALLRERPELMDHAVEELLRYVSVVASVSPRTAVADVPLGDQVIRAGERVGCWLFAANRAEQPGEGPDGLDVTRENAGHLAFGHGVHFCVGAALAKAQLGISFAGLLERFPDLRVAVPPEELRFRVESPQYGLEALPIAW
jgi:cytochrome P450